MDLNELFQSCRRGDLGKVKYLVEQKEVEINVRDKWDSTPLYYACLCGHVDIVRYLLENGAKCTANTFDGERCLYGAHDQEIRNLLRNFKVVSSNTKGNIASDSFELFLQRVLETGEYTDVSFFVHGEEFRLHRCILSARSEYFLEAFATKWRNKRIIHIVHELVRPSIFRAVVHHIYTDRLEIESSQVEDCIRLAKQCKLPQIIAKLEDAARKNYSFECTKPGTNVTRIIIEPTVLPNSSHNALRNSNILTDLQHDLSLLAEQALPLELTEWVGGSELPFLFPDWEELRSFVDLCIIVDSHTFLCHKVFFSGRSDYFKAIIRDYERRLVPMDADDSASSSVQQSLQSHIPSITLRDINAEVFVKIVHYMYYNTCELTVETVFDVLWAADMYLLPGLKRACGSFLGRHIECDNAVSLLRTARLFGLPRLEDLCTEFIARKLDVMIEDTSLHCLISEDAREVKHRQETDSIAVVDDIRYHITGNVQTFSAMHEAKEKIRMIDELLENLELDA